MLLWALRGGAGGEALRRAEMREQKCALNLPIVIGQTLPSQSRIRVQAASASNRGDRTVRFPVVMAGSRVSLFSLGGTIQPLFSQ